MSLNDDVLDDIENKETIIENTSNDFTDIDISKIDDTEAKHVAIMEQVANLKKLMFIRDDLIAQESINRIGANNIHAVFGNFLEDNLSIEQFTNNLTRTNYKESVRFMDRRISTEETNAVGAMTYFTNAQLNDLQVIITKIKLVYIQAIRELITTNFDINNIENILQSKNTIVMYNNEPINILGLDLSTLDLNQIKLNDTIPSDIIDNTIPGYHIANINELFKFNIFKVFFFSCINNDDINNILINPKYAEYMELSVTVKNLVEFLIANTKVDYLNIIESLVDKIDSNIKEISKHISDELNKAELVNIEGIILSKEKEITQLLKDVKNISLIIHSYPVLINNSSNFISFLAKL